MLPEAGDMGESWPVEAKQTSDDECLNICAYVCTVFTECLHKITVHLCGYIYIYTHIYIYYLPT